ncbi:phosphate signaling complex protein PhoU [Candidatus Acetothermia bacterium]|nr:phosphate signaling complex protein PhoU [Candidatus Acetothermia bacterium]MCI2426902.1 phosphate signaling complex protein PhoU [Candidatus Acetothermia bacterium]MCI2427959.1 phosphate signaling complex protein PhoU [Candidatus Acetothermia bacterium]
MIELRTAYHERLRELQDEVLIMGSMVEEAIGRSVEALKNRDLQLAEQVIENDQKINQRRFEIEESCITMIATQQPMASDLRIIITVLNLITELERMGDYAEGIARIALMIGDEPPLKPLIDIPRMAEKARDMLHRSLETFINRDSEEAMRITAEDDEVDNLYHQVFRELLLFMMEDPRTITRATRLLWVAHNLERIADRATNICERVGFTVTGKMVEIGTSKHTAK